MFTRESIAFTSMQARRTSLGCANNGTLRRMCGGVSSWLSGCQRTQGEQKFTLQVSKCIAEFPLVGELVRDAPPLEQSQRPPHVVRVDKIVDYFDRDS